MAGEIHLSSVAPHLCDHAHHVVVEKWSLGRVLAHPIRLRVNNIASCVQRLLHDSMGEPLFSATNDRDRSFLKLLDGAGNNYQRVSWLN